MLGIKKFLIFILGKEVGVPSFYSTHKNTQDRLGKSDSASAKARLKTMVNIPQEIRRTIFG